MGNGQNQPPQDSALSVVRSAQTTLGSMPTNQSGQTQWPVRWIAVAPQGSSFPVQAYRGSGLVGRRNTIERGQYDTSEGAIRDVYAQLAGNPEQRALVQAKLKQKGFYGGTRVGIPDNDLNAIKSWLEYSNNIGVTYDRALDEMDKSIPDYEKPGGGPRYRVSNPADIKAAVNRAFQETIGRAANEQELAMVVPGFQQAQIQGQMGTVAAPDVGQFAQGAAEFFAPTEAQGYKFLGYMNRLFQVAGGR